MAKILHIEDDSAHQRVVRLLLKDALKESSSSLDQISMFNGDVKSITGYDIYLLDHLLPMHNGIEIAEELRDVVDTKIILFTGVSEEMLKDKVYLFDCICEKDDADYFLINISRLITNNFD